ncbi:MAG: hypothetical protein ACTHL8_17475 [Burkholderiaceae bacterium]
MNQRMSLLAIAVAGALSLSGCGGGASVEWDGGGPPPDALVSDIGTTGVFVAFADPTTQSFYSAPMGSYAGKRQVLRGTIDFTTNAELGQLAGLEVYKGSDGHIHALDLTTFDQPQPQQLSSESAATVDDTCSLGGTQVAGAAYTYAGVYFAADLQDPTNSSYFYRLPGSTGACNSGSDVVRMVKTGMSAGDAPLTVPGMPVATVRTAGGGIAGFVVVEGAQLVLVDAGFGHPVVLGTFASPITTAQALPVGTTSGYPTAQLFEVDGEIVNVDYAAHAVSAPLFSLPGWSATAPGALFAASPTTLYFAQNLPAASGSAAATEVYAMPADGSAAPVLVDREAGRTQQLAFAVGAGGPVWSVSNGGWSLRSVPQAGGAVATLATSASNDGSFVATAANVFFTTWNGATDPATHVVTRSGTASAIVRADGTVLQAPLSASMFASAGEALPWPDDTTTTATPLETVFQVRGLTTVTVKDAGSGTTYVVDGASGGTLISVDATTGQPIATPGTLPTGTATFLAGTFRDDNDDGFIEATNPLSTGDPATRDLYILNAREDGSLARVTDNL